MDTPPVVLNAQHYLTSLCVSHTVDEKVAYLPHSSVSSAGVRAMAKFHLFQCFQHDSHGILQLSASCPPLHRCVTPEMAAMLCGAEGMPQLAQLACSLWRERFCSSPLDNRLSAQLDRDCVEQRPRKRLRSEPRPLDAVVDSVKCAIDAEACPSIQFHRMMCRTVLTLTDVKCSPVVGASLVAHLPATDGRRATTRFSLFDRKVSAPHSINFQFELTSSVGEEMEIRHVTQEPNAESLELLSDDALQRAFTTHVVVPLSRVWTDEQNADASAFAKSSTQRCISFLSWLSHRCRSQSVLTQLMQTPHLWSTPTRYNRGDLLCDVVTSSELQVSASANETMLRCRKDNGDTEWCLEVSVRGVEDCCRWGRSLIGASPSDLKEGPLGSLITYLGDSWY